ncbi:MAG: hypothetical protein ABI185_12060 [Ginsengibacter sp.]
MEITLQQEILIMTGTSFSSRLYCQDIGINNKIYTETEHLQEACWNGLLPAMLPEICEWAFQNKTLYLWQVKENRSCIEIDIAEAPSMMERIYSIDPYAFLSVKLMN